MSRFVRVGGVPHHVVVEGSGPVCVLSAGLALCWFDWDPVVPLLAPHRTVVRFDRPGHGLSGPARAAPTACGEAHRIAALLDALGMGGERVTVVGHSVAGLHAEAFARLYPARTAALVLADASAEEEARAPAPGATALRTALARGTAPCSPPRACPPRSARAPAARWSGSPARGARPTRPPASGYGAATAPAASWTAPCWRTRTTGPSPPTSSPCAPAGRCPGPARHGAGRAGLPDGTDRWTARQRALAAALGARLALVRGSGHLIMLDRPGAVAGAVLGPPGR